VLGARVAEGLNDGVALLLAQFLETLKVDA
jgi:hypothetical protein